MHKDVHDQSKEEMYQDFKLVMEEAEMLNVASTSLSKSLFGYQFLEISTSLRLMHIKTSFEALGTRSYLNLITIAR